MITDKDIKKLKEVFATKDDLKNQTKHFDDKFATKDDLKEQTKYFEDKFATKDDIKKLATNDSVRALRDDVLTVIEMIGDLGVKLDKKTLEHDDMLENHERRLDKVENKVFPTI